MFAIENYGSSVDKLKLDVSFKVDRYCIANHIFHVHIAKYNIKSRSYNMYLFINSCYM